MTNGSTQVQVAINVNLLAIHDDFLVQLQHLVDMLTFAYASMGAVKHQDFENYKFFTTYEPAANRRLDFGSAKSEMENWVVRSLLRDAVDFTGVLLDNCRTACAFFRLSTQTSVTKEQVERIPEQEKDKFNLLHIPTKLSELSKQFGVRSELEPHFLSLNRIRNCLVHRLGVVGSQDLNESSTLSLKLRTMQLVARSPDGKDKVIIDKPGPVEIGWQIEMETSDSERVFKLGERLRLTYREMYDSIVTLALFGNTLLTSVGRYSDSVGVPRASTANTKD